MAGKKKETKVKSKKTKNVAEELATEINKKKKAKKKEEEPKEKEIITTGLVGASQSERITAMKAVSKKFGVHAHIISPKDMEWENQLWASTGSLKLDYAIKKSFNNAGIKLGHIIEFYGKDSSGKNVFAHTMQKTIMRRGLNADFFDVENKADHTWLKILLEETYSMLGYAPANGGAENILATVQHLVEKRLSNLILVDSSSALKPISEINKAVDDTDKREKMAARATLMTNWLPKIIPGIKNMQDNYACGLIFTSQMSVSNMSGYGEPENSTASSSLKHAAALRIRFKKGDALTEKMNNSDLSKAKNGADKIGNYHRLIIIKNNFGPDGLAIDVPVIQNHGIDNDFELFELARDVQVLDNLEKGFWYYKGETIGNGIRQTVQKMKSDPDLLARIKEDTFKIYENEYIQQTRLSPEEEEEYAQEKASTRDTLD